MKKELRNILKIIFLMIFVTSLGLYAYRTVQSQSAEKEYDEAAELANVPAVLEEEIISEETELVWREGEVSDDPYMEGLETIDLDILQDTNEDVIGWIVIPDTQLSYPIVQGEDNDYYLAHTWVGEENIAGAIFMEQYNSAVFDDFNTILYGHHMIDGAMFGSLRDYDSQSHFEEHPYVYIRDGEGSHRYEIFAAYETELESSAYRLGMKKDETKESFIHDCLERSVIDTGIEPEITDRILTLSTCTRIGNANRWVVQARLIGVEEEVPVKN